MAVTTHAPPGAAAVAAGDPAPPLHLLDSSPDAVVRLDRAHRYLWMNRAAERLVGAAAPQCVGRTSAELGMPAQFVELWTARVARLFETGAEDAFEFPFPTEDGVRHFRARLVAEPAGAARPCTVAAVLRDVSERAQLEAQLRQAQKMEAAGRLAGGVAHEFNNLLTVIGTYCQFLADDFAPEDPRRADVGEIRKAADRAAGLTRQLLAFSRRQPLPPRHVDLGLVVAETGALLRRVLGEDVEIVATLAPNLPSVLADPGQLEHVIVNLALNARDAMPTGGVLAIATAAAPDRGAVRVTVRDDGAGMDEATRARAADPFFTTRAADGAAGLGLSTARTVVERSGGRITIESAPGGGTTVVVELPAAPAAAALVQDAPEGPHVPGGSETVLVVEDDDAVRGAVRRALELRGYHVLDAADGPDAVGAAARHAGPIDLLLTDVVMPQLDGREVATRLRRARPLLRVIYMSGYADARAAAAPDERFLRKPFSAAEIARTVREALDAE